MSAFFAERALLPNGWANHVRLEVSADGMLTQSRPIPPQMAPNG
jgi:formimidoylglutamate deiminase